MNKEIIKPYENGFCESCSHCDKEDNQCKAHHYLACGQILTCKCYKIISKKVERMKEYIDKQKLVEHIALEKRRWKRDGYGASDILVDIDDMQTYTQTELESAAYDRGAREFAEKLKEKYSEYMFYNDDGLQDIDISVDGIFNEIDKLLDEWRCCDGTR